jgi:hypothetical protein
VASGRAHRPARWLDRLMQQSRRGHYELGVDIDPRHRLTARSSPNLPTPSNRASTLEISSVSRLRNRPLHPPVHTHMIDSDPGVGPAPPRHGRTRVAQVPANCHDDHIRRERKSSKRGPRQRYSTSATMHSAHPAEPLIPQRSSAPTGRLRNLGYS